MRHAPTAATRAAAFPADEPVDNRGLTAARALAGVLPRPYRPMSSAALRCRQTAAAAGLEEPRLEPGLAECDFGSWSGRSLAEIHEAEPGAAREWMTDPEARPHGGESLAAFAARVSSWLEEQAGLDGRVVAITHGGVVKAAVVRALGAPIEAFWRIDAAPLGITELHAHHGRWTVTRLNANGASQGRLEAETQPQNAGLDAPPR